MEAELKNQAKKIECQYDLAIIGAGQSAAISGIKSISCNCVVRYCTVGDGQLAKNVGRYSGAIPPGCIVCEQTVSK